MRGWSSWKCCSIHTWSTNREKEHGNSRHWNHTNTKQHWDWKKERKFQFSHFKTRLWTSNQTISVSILNMTKIKNPNTKKTQNILNIKNWKPIRLSRLIIKQWKFKNLKRTKNSWNNSKNAMRSNVSVTKKSINQSIDRSTENWKLNHWSSQSINQSNQSIDRSTGNCNMNHRSSQSSNRSPWRTHKPVKFCHQRQTRKTPFNTYPITEENEDKERSRVVPLVTPVVKHDHPQEAGENLLESLRLALVDEQSGGAILLGGQLGMLLAALQLTEKVGDDTVQGAAAVVAHVGVYQTKNDFIS